MNANIGLSLPLWSDDILWAADSTEEAVLFLDDTGRLAYGNEPAYELAKQLAHDNPENLLAFIPELGWEIASRQGRWKDEVVTSPGGIVLEVKLFAGIRGGQYRQYAIMSDISVRSAREAELLRRNDEVQKTYSRLASTQDQLLQNEKLASIGQLAAGVAHEINNPIGYVHSNLGTLQEYVGALLGLIDGYARLTATPHPEIAQLRERLDIDFIVGDLPKLLEESREGIERVTKIVQDLKEFSYLERGSEMRPSELRKGLESTLNIVWHDLKYKAKIEKIYQDLPMVECNLSELNQVFMNLLINAGQAIDKDGTITLATGVEGSEVWVSVTDTGAGMTEETLLKLFDPFYTTKPIGKGTGLGLPIAYRIVAKHHGRIEVSSRLGYGSTFKVVLPIKQPAQPPASQ